MFGLKLWMNALHRFARAVLKQIFFFLRETNKYYAIFTMACLLRSPKFYDITDQFYHDQMWRYSKQEFWDLYLLSIFIRFAVNHTFHIQFNLSWNDKYHVKFGSCFIISRSLIPAQVSAPWNRNPGGASLFHPFPLSLRFRFLPKQRLVD